MMMSLSNDDESVWWCLSIIDCETLCSGSSPRLIEARASLQLTTILTTGNTPAAIRLPSWWVTILARC